jgi:hypothetical protein
MSRWPSFGPLCRLSAGMRGLAAPADVQSFTWDKRAERVSQFVERLSVRRSAAADSQPSPQP